MDDKLTGKSAEEFVSWMCTSSFLSDYVFPNPLYKRGAKLEKELCDVLVVFEKTIIIVQVKAAESLRTQGGVGVEKIARWNQKKRKEAIEQVVGAKKAILKGLCKSVSNERRGCVEFEDIDEYKIYGLTVVDRPMWNQNGMGIDDNGMCHFDLNFFELQQFMEELTTIGDFLDYLDWRTKVHKSLQLNDASELDVLAVYVQRRDLAAKILEVDIAIVEPGSWDSYQASDHRREKLVLEKESYLIDIIAGELHKTIDSFLLLKAEDAGGPTKGLPKAENIEILDRISRTRRFHRRLLAQKILEKDRLCIETERSRYFSEKFIQGDLPIFVFVASGDGRQERLSFLNELVRVVSARFPEDEIVGIASSPSNHKVSSLDYCYIPNFEHLEVDADGLEELKLRHKELFQPDRHERTHEWQEVKSAQQTHRVSGSKADKKRNKGFKKRKR